MCGGNGLKGVGREGHDRQVTVLIQVNPNAAIGVIGFGFGNNLALGLIDQRFAGFKAMGCRDGVSIRDYGARTIARTRDRQLDVTCAELDSLDRVDGLAQNLGEGAAFGEFVDEFV